MPTTLAGLTARDTYDALTGSGALPGDATRAMLRSWARGSARVRGLLVTASGNPDGAEHATYRITIT